MIGLKRLREIHEAGEQGLWEAIERAGIPGTYALYCDGQDMGIDVPEEHTAEAIVAAMNSHAALLDLADAVEMQKEVSESNRNYLLTDELSDALSAVIKISEEME